MAGRIVYNPLDRGTSGVWGTVTSSIDWCERNYDTRLPIAEAANALTNVAFCALAWFGFRAARQERLPTKVAMLWVGMFVVGAGSFLFHATLRYEAQLADELPMIFAGSLLLYVALAAGKTSNRGIGLFLTAYDCIVSITYIVYPNVHFFQGAYAIIVLWTVIRTTYLLQTRLLSTPAEIRMNQAIRRVAWQGFALYFVAWLLWNADSLACVPLTQVKAQVGWPLSLMLEGHAHWHLLVGLASHYMGVSIGLLYCVLLPDGGHHFRLDSTLGGLVPFIKRTAKDTAVASSMKDRKARAEKGLAQKE